MFSNNFNNNDINANNNLNNNGRFAGIARAVKTSCMKTYKNLWKQLISCENLEIAFRKARKGKTKKAYVKDFEGSLKENLLLLSSELALQTYKPRPLKTIIIKDPKTRKISKAEFRDRVIHHTLCNIIEPIFDKSFIHDSYANRKGKGALKALQRFDCFKRKVSRNNKRLMFVLKADIKRYFESVDQKILLEMIEKKIKDSAVLWLIKKILDNHGKNGIGMPLGNLTSQFFANVYLNKLDWFVKQKLNAKYYMRYVDDFVILHHNKEALESYKEKIQEFLKGLKLELHEGKSKIKALSKGVGFLGFRVFYYHKLLKKSNAHRSMKRLIALKRLFDKGDINYDSAYARVEGWLAYAKIGNTYKLRNKILDNFRQLFENRIASVEIDRWLKASNA